ncbi:hypothetical protein DFR70_105270 [Nocardia tenerifensis]|uniref:Uncharacterized protein n=1 Tax=Nocardia tenerifensis TaxID=228006 RepID=A0A318K1D8_9NOCA|nr:hypothetical protein [Nocardia tenerifensis]PXX64088.1 hypothetical protein DFR70_105270 [Nocardia tenerifensis]
MSAIRILLLLAGLGLGWYGATLLLDFPRADLLSVALWFVGGILLHDTVFAPLCAAAGVTARRVLPDAWWAPTACGAVCTVALLLIAAPVLGRAHAVPDNPTVLDRDYPLGLAVALLAVWALVGVALVTRLAGRRRSEKPRSTP